MPADPFLKGFLLATRQRHPLAVENVALHLPRLRVQLQQRPVALPVDTERQVDLGLWVRAEVVQGPLLPRQLPEQGSEHRPDQRRLADSVFSHDGDQPPAERLKVNADAVPKGLADTTQAELMESHGAPSDKPVYSQSMKVAAASTGCYRSDNEARGLHKQACAGSLRETQPWVAEGRSTAALKPKKWGRNNGRSGCLLFPEMAHSTLLAVINPLLQLAHEAAPAWRARAKVLAYAGRRSDKKRNEQPLPFDPSGFGGQLSQMLCQT